MGNYIFDIIFYTILGILETVQYIYFFDTFMEKRPDCKLNVKRIQVLVYLCWVFLCAYFIIDIMMLRVSVLCTGFIFMNKYFYKASWKECISFSTLGIIFILILDFAVVVSGSLLSNGAIAYGSVFMIIIAKLVQMFVMILIRRKFSFHGRLEIVKSREWSMTVIITLLTYAEVGLAGYFFPRTNVEEGVYMLFIIGFLATNLLILRLLESAQKKEEINRVNILENQNFRNQIEAYQNMKETYDCERRKMHDYKNQLQTIQTMIKNGETQAAEHYVEKLTESISVYLSAVNTNHPVVNAVLNNKYRMATQKGIPVILTVGDLHDIRLSEEEIVILISNLFDNAIRECEKVKLECEKEKKERKKAVIQFKFVNEEGRIVLSIKNTVREKVEISGNGIFRQAPDGHGIGLANVRNVVEHYGGDLILDCNEKEFQVLVLMEKARD